MVDFQLASFKTVHRVVLYFNTDKAFELEGFSKRLLPVRRHLRVWGLAHRGSCPWYEAIPAMPARAIKPMRIPRRVFRSNEAMLKPCEDLQYMLSTTLTKPRAPLSQWFEA